MRDGRRLTGRRGRDGRRPAGRRGAKMGGDQWGGRPTSGGRWREWAARMTTLAAPFLLPARTEGAAEDGEDVVAGALVRDDSGEVGPLLEGDAGQHGRGRRRRLLLVTASSSSLRLPNRRRAPRRCWLRG
ncbi:Os06g0169700 [Oryza sativa Japonica Group]|uniref:Os06g0169700 protein n=1 Tax=Oryza sativa subsp. japonica TaxID=39947 RepID=A0A0P0WTC6_ORYSJ|nr:Os06g0169700 [Oryza sativa Japonica Group]